MTVGELLQALQQCPLDFVVQFQSESIAGVVVTHNQTTEIATKYRGVPKKTEHRVVYLVTEERG